MLPNKFRVNWPVGSGKEAKKKKKIDFQDGDTFGVPIGSILAIFFLSTSHLMLHTKFRANWPRAVGGV